MKALPKQIDKNKRNCIVCNAEFFAFPSSNKHACGSDGCVLVMYSNKTRKHGESRSRLHSIWCGVKSRCRNHPRYLHLEVSAAWSSYEPFKDWALSSGYTETLEIDRIDNAKGYSPENCRWATRHQQMQNTTLRKQKNKTSQYKGVQKLKHTKKKWRAMARVGGKPKSLGLYETEVEAAKVYDAWVKAEYGEFASPNFKEE